MEDTVIKQQHLVKRYFTRIGDDPYKMVEWNKRNVSLKDADDKTLLDKEIEAPITWSDSAITIAAYKYLRKRGVGGPEGFEDSIRQLVYRVANTIRNAGVKLGHITDGEEAETFEKELAYVLLTQRAAFNSPVWFNVGLWHQYSITGHSDNFFWNMETNEIERALNGFEHPQASACFIQSVKDDLSDIFDLVQKESKLFKYGSGTGTNFSTLRSSSETISGGGKSSGVMSFLNVLDAGAGATKSGGTTRRAAKMAILNVNHPEIMDFVGWKAREEEKAKILIEHGGLPADFNGEAYQTVGGQNSNNSVRVTDEFMKAYEEGKSWDLIGVTNGEVIKTLPAKEIMGKIAKSAWACADPGMQYDTIINKWHTVKKSGRINASNPCSEYMFLDDSACNLASINLVKYMNEDDSLNIEAFRHTIDLLVTAQEILVDFASYPSRNIAQSSHNFRPLGLGYANIGAYLMRIGLPYDSDKGRDLAAGITAIMTGRAYLQSAKIASKVGTFPEYEKNSESMLTVMNMHKEAVGNISHLQLQGMAREDWDKAIEMGKQHGFRNAQTSLLAPTGTIGLLMDCDTTGIEPDFALVKYKKLAGGGNMTFVNQSVKPSLEKLGYSKEHTKEITDYILKTGKIEGAPKLKDEHLAVFDCASRCADGKRFIQPMAHVDMMAAVQPFLSGAISKTVNMPEEVTVEDVEKIYIEAWKKGIKALALYRDNCKSSQPLTTKDDTEEQQGKKIVYKSKSMPKTRKGITHNFLIGSHKVYIIANTYEDGKLGEVFLMSSKEGSIVAGLLDTLARLISKTLQSGESVESIIESLINMRFEPWGATDDEFIPFAKSIPDYIARWLAREFVSSEKRMMLGIIDDSSVDNTIEEDVVGASIGDIKSDNGENEAPELVKVQESLNMSSKVQNSDVAESSAPPCPTCGGLMVRNGTCYVCRECGSTTGCS